MVAPVLPPGPAVTYNGSILPLSVPKINAEPKEGRRTVPVSIKWAVDSGQFKNVHVNVQNPQIVSLSQIITLYVDNLRNANQATILFYDTQFVIDIPAFSEGYYPVVTNALEFDIWCPLGADSDATNINILNYFVPPGAVSSFAFSDTTSHQINSGTNLYNDIFTPLNNGSVTTLTLSPALTEGIITAFQIVMRDLEHINNGIYQIMLMDIAQTIAYYSTNTSGYRYAPYLVLAEMTNVAIPFNNGLLGVVSAISGTNPVGAGNCVFNVYWRVPT